MRGRCAEWSSTQHLGLRSPQRPARTRRSLADLSGASIARLPIRHRGRRHDLRPAHEVTLRLRAVIIARRRTELAKNTRRSYQRRLDRDLSAIMGAGSHQSARQAAAKTLRQEPKPLVHLPGTSRHTARQQRQRTGTPANYNISQDNRWLSVKLGRRFVRRR